MSVGIPPDSKKLVEALFGDLRLLSTEAKKKYNHVKEAAETGVVRVRNINGASSESNLLTNLRAASSELLHPLALACATRQARLVQVALQGIQRLVQHRILETSSATLVVSELWGLVESECEELRVLQTVPPLVSADLLVSGQTLSKCIGMCFRLYFAKDPVVINAASAAIRQLFSCVFERVIQEDGIFSSELTVVTPSGGRPSSRPLAPPTLRPCAADAYMLFKDLCLVLNEQDTVWLPRMNDSIVVKNLCLELLESVLSGFPSVYFRHTEFTELLKSEVCPLVIKLFSPNLKSLQVSSQHPSSRMSQPPSTPPDRPVFPVAMRLVRIVGVLVSYYHQLLSTECEIFVCHLLKLVDSERRGWQRALALEAIHKIVARTDIVRWMVETFDSKSNSTKLLEQIAQGLWTVVQQGSVPTQLSSDIDSEYEMSQQQGGPGFAFRRLFVPYLDHLTPKNTLFLSSLDKCTSSTPPDGYNLSRTCTALTDLTQAVFAAVDALALQEEQSKSKSPVAMALFTSSQPSLLASLHLLLDASTDETVTDQLLCAISTLVAVGCKLGAIQDTHKCLYVLCGASLPAPNYLTKYASLPSPSDDVLRESAASYQFMASGPPCPSPVVQPELWNDQVVLTARNLQAARVMLITIGAHATALQSLWYLSLCSAQHLAWLLCMRPTSSGTFSREKSDAESQGSGTQPMFTVTTAALAEAPILASLIDNVMAATCNLSEDKLTKVVEEIIRLSDENLAVAATGRDCSLFPLALLLRLSSLNLSRMAAFWTRSTNHFIKVCGHTSATLRDWAAVALTSLIKQALKAKTSLPQVQQQEMCVTPLSALCDTSQSDVRRRQLDCLMAILQTDGASLQPPLWPSLLHVISAIVEHDAGCDAALVRQGYMGLRLISADFLQSLPFDCVSTLGEATARYGKQLADHNISLSALEQLWTISDFVFRKKESVGAEAAEKVWLVLYTCLSELCVDKRPPVRKSACQTLLQTVAAHGHALRPSTWTHMIWQIIMPLLDKVRSLTRNASTERAVSDADLLMHHSRDTEQKQWTETCIYTLMAAAKMFNAQRRVLLALDDFGSAWEALLSYLEWAACYENAELSLNAIKSFQEVLLGRVSAQTLEINSRDRSASNADKDTQLGEDAIPTLPLAQWVESWHTWQRMSRGLAKLGAAASQGPPTGVATKGYYVPGPSHLTTLLHIFPALFERVARHISADELSFENLPSVLESMVNVPVSTEQAPFVLPSAASQLTPTQEAVLDATRTIYTECISPQSPLRAAIADQMRLLLRFAAHATRPAMRTAPRGNKDYREWAEQCVIPFAETSLRFCVEMFAATAAYPETLRSLVIVDIVKFLGEPLYLKYSCVCASTWKLAASSLMTVLRIGIPLALQQADHFTPLWESICDTLEKFLFSPNSSSRLAADERKRDELTECQAVELVRSELLSHADRLPASAVRHLIAILNRGSINQLDPTDVLDSHTQRSDLARACFDALLSTSNEGDGSLGHVAVTSLLQRCTQVMTDFVGDSSGAGDLHLPRSRVAELSSALLAVDSLIARLARDPSLSELYSQLVSLFPSVVQLVPCSRMDPYLEIQLVSTLKSYQTLLLLKAVPNFTS